MSEVLVPYSGEPSQAVRNPIDPLQSAAGSVSMYVVSMYISKWQVAGARRGGSWLADSERADIVTTDERRKTRDEHRWRARCEASREEWSSFSMSKLEP